MNAAIELRLLAGSQQRAHERFRVKVPGILRVPGAPSATYLITMLDASQTGLRVSCPSAIHAGTRVEVIVLGTTIQGIARYAREVDREFNVGIEAYAVEHLTENFDLTSIFVDHQVGPPRSSVRGDEAAPCATSICFRQS
jgi:hypothetical protein